MKVTIALYYISLFIQITFSYIAAVIFHTFESSSLHKRVYVAWVNSIIRSAALVGPIITKSSTDLAEDYHSETVMSLKTTRSADVIKNILDEFSGEVFLDLRLKNAVFRSKELLLQIQIICQRTLATPTPDLLLNSNITMTSLPIHFRDTPAATSNAVHIDFLTLTRQGPPP